MVAASAAMSGLLFVAVSINLDRIIAPRSLPGAALGAIVLLVAQAATLPIVIAGCRCSCGPAGSPGSSPGLAFSLVVAAVNAWMLLVEVVR